MENNQETLFLNVKPIDTRNWKQKLDTQQLNLLREGVQSKPNKNVFVADRKLIIL